MRARIVSFFIFFSAICFFGYAHPPTDIEITPDFKNSNLKIDITHPVSNPRKRYIDKVAITIDDKEPIVKYFFFQTGVNKVFTIQIPDLDKAKNIVIKARCKHGGSLEKRFNMDDFKETSKK